MPESLCGSSPYRRDTNSGRGSIPPRSRIPSSVLPPLAVEGDGYVRGARATRRSNRFDAHVQVRCNNNILKLITIVFFTC